MTRALVAMTAVMAVVIAITLWLHTLVTPADVMIQYAQEAVDKAQKHHRIQLDFSEQSIEQVDALLDQQKHLSAEQCAYNAKLWGGYLGEVIRRQHGGVWKQPATGEFAGAYVLQVKGTQLSPPLKIHRGLVNGEESKLTAYYDQLLQEWSR